MRAGENTAILFSLDYPAPITMPVVISEQGSVPGKPTPPPGEYTIGESTVTINPGKLGGAFTIQTSNVPDSSFENCVVFGLNSPQAGSHIQSTDAITRNTLCILSEGKIFVPMVSRN